MLSVFYDEEYALISEFSYDETHSNKWKYINEDCIIEHSFIKIYFEHYLLTNFIWMDVLWTCIAVQFASRSHEDQKGAPDPPGLDLQMVVSCKQKLGIEPRSSGRPARPLTHWATPPALSWAFLACEGIVLGVYSWFLSHICSLFLVSSFFCRKQGYTRAIPANVCVESEGSERFVNKNWILEKLEGKSRNSGLFSGFSCRLVVMLDVLGVMRLPLCVLT